MNLTDIILIAIAVIFVASGWTSGFVRAAGSLLAFVASVIAAFYAMSWFHDTFGIAFTANPWLTIVAFLVLVIIANKLASYLVDTLDLIRKVAGFLPFVNLLNSVLGAAVGLLQMGTLLIAFVYLVVTLLPVGDWRTAIVSSTIVSRVIDVETSFGVL